MRRLLFVTLTWLAFNYSPAQNPSAALEGKATPQERYFLMKKNSQTFQDYKVIKENILDAVWKIETDSLTKRDNQLADAKAVINSLQNDLTQVRSALKSKEDSMADIVYASTHISVLGRGLTKKTFLIIVGVAVLALCGVIILLLINLRNMQVFVSESNLMMMNLTHEFDEHKRIALEKQVKLSRELQTERNKLTELREIYKA